MMKDVRIGEYYEDPEGTWKITGWSADGMVEIINMDTDQKCVVRESEAFYYLNGGDKMFDQAMEYMDSELREELHDELSPCDPDIFLWTYIKRHKEQFGEDFEI